MSVWAPGIRLGPYELTAPLGAGGMGEVWKARDTRVDRVVAIKRLKAEHAERFKREARAIPKPCKGEKFRSARRSAAHASGHRRLLLTPPLH